MSARNRRKSAQRPGLLALALGALVVVMLPAVTANAAPLPTATGAVVTSLGSPSISVPVTAGTPAAYIVKNVPFSLNVCFVGASATVSSYTHPLPRAACTAANGALPLSYNKDVTVSLRVIDGPAGGPWTAVVPKGSPSATFTGTFAAAYNDVVLEVSNDAKRPADVVSTRTDPFDVLITSATAPASSGLTGIGGGGGVGTSCDANPTDQVCADLLLPSGVAIGNGLLSLVLCGDLCAGQQVQVLVGLNVDRSNPAALVMKCDKTLCTGGSIRSFPLSVMLVPGTPSETAPECPAKGTVGPLQKFCVDYVQSTRDSAGDTHLYLLFVDDAKVRFS